MQQSNKIAIANARQLADITTLLSAANSADEAREIFRERYPFDFELASTPPKGEPGEPEFWLELIKVASRLDWHGLHLDFDAQFILACTAEAEGREILYSGRLRDGSQGVIYIPHVLKVTDDPENAIIIENCDFDNIGFSSELRYYDEEFDAEGELKSCPARLEAYYDSIRLNPDQQQAIAEALLRIDRELFGANVRSIKYDQLMCAVKETRYCHHVVSVDEAIKKFKTETLNAVDTVEIAIDDDVSLDMTEPYFATWLWVNLMDF